MPLFSLPGGRPEQVPRRLLASIMDMAGFALCGLLAFQLRFDGSVPAIYATWDARGHLYMGRRQVGCVFLWRGQYWLLALYLSR